LVLIIDDDSDMRWALRTLVAGVGLGVVEASTGIAGIETAERTAPDAVLLDLQLPGLSGEKVLHGLRRQHHHTPIIVITGYGSISGAVEAIKAGAFDYLTKPFNNDAVAAAVKRAIEQHGAAVREPNIGLRNTVTDLMGRSPAIQSMITQMEAVIATDYSVLLCGETGTGKEIVAQALYRYGPRTTRPLVVFDCGSIVEALVESEFFGHERGAYTGAHERRRGRFELAADGGTIFLDEIGNLCAVGQQALLRALEERVIYRVGGTQPIRLDTRVIAATSENLTDDDDDDSTFRPDLFYRLSEYSIVVPPLRTRPEDIEYLAHRFLNQTQRVLGTGPQGIAPEALNLLLGYSWPGNVRQLRNVMRRAALTASNLITAENITAGMLRRRPQVAVHAPIHSDGEMPLRDLVGLRVQQVEREAIVRALKAAGGNKAEAARRLGLDYKTLRIKLKAFERSDLPIDELPAC
jgi:two-component system nitrogen regulation response regulator GlnG